MLLGTLTASLAWGGDYDPAVLPGAVGQTWVERDGQVYGARPDARGPIGGGAGYQPVVTHGEVTVRTVEELIQALKQAKPGQVIFIPGTVELDLTGWVLAEQLALEIPGGVTLASDRGHNGSAGALLFSDELKTPALIRVLGAKVRITGLRLRGPDPLMRLDFHRRCFSPGGPGHTLYYQFPKSNGIVCEADELEVDNCELSGWSHGAVTLRRSRGHHVHHNYIHHNQHHGLGYGTALDAAEALIDFNLYDYNRHHIASTGRPGSSYEAAHNVSLTHANSHQFDMHGGRDRKDGTTIAGTWMKIHHNAFWHPEVPAVVIRGVPEQLADLHHNWFILPTPGHAVVRSDGNTTVANNLYGQPPQAREEKYSFPR